MAVQLAAEGQNTFEGWLNNDRTTQDKIWLLNGGRCLGFSSVLTEIFRGIIKHLVALLAQGRYSEVFSRRLRITESIVLRRVQVEVQFEGDIGQNMGMGGGANVVGRIKSMLILFKDMVETVGLIHPPPFHFRAWETFRDEVVYSPTPYLDLVDMRKVAVAIFTHPMFYNELDSSHYILLTYDLFEIKPWAFKLVNSRIRELEGLYGRFAEIRSERNRIPASKIKYTRREATIASIVSTLDFLNDKDSYYEINGETAYSKPYGVFLYIRNSLFHRHYGARMSDVMALNQLIVLEAMAIFHVELLNLFWSNSYAHDLFGISLFDQMNDGPLGFHCKFW